MSEALRVLLIDDNPDDRALTIRALREEFDPLQVEEITDAREFERALEAGTFDVVITDYQLCWSNGLEVLRAVKERWPDRPVVMFTATGTEEIAVEAMKAGLDDYVLKSPKHFGRLPAVLRLVLARAAERRRLREAEVRYQRLFERVPVGLYRTAPDGRILDANPALAQMLGCGDPQTLLGVNAADFYLDPEDRRREQALLEREGVVRGFEMRLRRCDGTVIWVRDTVRAVCDAEGRVLYYEGSLEDITEWKRTEEALRESEERFRALTEQALAGVYLIQDGRFRYVNPALAKMVGYEPEEIIDQLSPLDLVAPEDRDLVAENIRRRIEGEIESIHYDFHGLRKDGSTFDCEVLGVRVEYKGRPAVLGMLMDVTERKQAQEALERRAAQLEALRQVGLQITSELDLDTLLRSIVDQAVRLLGGDFGGLYLYRPDRDVLEWVVAVGDLPVLLGATLRRGEGLSGRVWETGEPLLVEDYCHWEGRAAIYEGCPYRAVVGAPIRWGGELLGVINVVSNEPGTFSYADAELLTLFATQAAIAIRNAQLYERVQRERARLDTLYNVSRLLAGGVGLEQVARAALEAASYVGAEHGDLILLEIRGRPVVFSTVPDRSAMTPEEAAEFVHQITTFGLEHWVLEHRESVLIQDTKEDPRWFTLPGHEEAEPVRSVVCVPLIDRRGEVMGFLLYTHSQPGVFDRETQLLVEEIAGRLAVAVEAACLYEAEREQRELAEALAQVAAVVNSTLDLDQVLGRILEQVGRVVPNEAANIMLIEGDEVRVARWRGYEKFGAAADFVSSVVFRLSEVPNLQQMKETREPIVIPDTVAYPGWVQVPEQAWLRSYAGVPIIVRGEVIGFLNVDSATPGFFKEAHLEALRAFADTVASAIENARLYQAEQHRREEAETLREAALALSTARDPEVVVERILAELQRVVPYDTASVQLLEGNLLRIVGGRGFPNLEELLGIAFDVTRDDNPNRRVVEARAPFILEDAPTAYAEFHREPHAAAGIRSWLGVPMVVGERLIGMIALDKQEPGFYTEEHARLAEAFAAQAAVALENARLYQAEREQRELAEALAQAAAVASSTLDLDRVLDHILEQVGRVVPGDAFNIALIEDGEARIVRARGYERFGLAGRVVDLTLSIETFPTLAEMVHRGEPTVVADVTIDPRWIPREGWEWMRSYVGAPIRLKGLTVGFVNVDGTRPGQFGPDDARRLQVFADHVATAVENARLYRQLRGYAEDLEERVRERTVQLTAQYARLEAILNSIADGVIVIDADGNILQANPVARAWLDRTLVPEDAARLREAIRELATRAEERPEEVLELTGLDLELSAAPVSEPGAEGAAVVAIHDVSHLRALDRMKTRFVSNISHELRTPIATIKLYADLMRRQPGRWSEHLERLEAEVDHLTELVEEILEVSRIDAGRLALEFQPVALNDLVEAAVAGHRLLAGERKLTLEYHPAEPGPAVEVDPDRMRQVLNNLLENAIRYTPSGGRVIVSTGRAQANGRTWATVTVSDTGIGIPDDELPHIFERFFRGREPRQMQISGTGLGLSIVKEIVELHGGQVTVESQVGEGSTFTVWLPLVEDRP